MRGSRPRQRAMVTVWPEDLCALLNERLPKAMQGLFRPALQFKGLRNWLVSHPLALEQAKAWLESKRNVTFIGSRCAVQMWRVIEREIKAAEKKLPASPMLTPTPPPSPAPSVRRKGRRPNRVTPGWPAATVPPEDQERQGSLFKW